MSAKCVATFAFLILRLSRTLTRFASAEVVPISTMFLSWSSYLPAPDAPAVWPFDFSNLLVTLATRSLIDELVSLAKTA